MSEIVFSKWEEKKDDIFVIFHEIVVSFWQLPLMAF